jgi:hypothetical protein
MASNAETAERQLRFSLGVKENPGTLARRKGVKDEKIKCSTGDFLARDGVCDRIFGAS